MFLGVFLHGQLRRHRHGGHLSPRQLQVIPQEFPHPRYLATHPGQLLDPLAGFRHRVWRPSVKLGFQRFLMRRQSTGLAVPVKRPQALQFCFLKHIQHALHRTPRGARQRRDPLMRFALALEPDDLHPLLHARIGVLVTLLRQSLLNFRCEDESTYPCSPSVRTPRASSPNDPRRPRWISSYLADDSPSGARAVCAIAPRAKYKHPEQLSHDWLREHLIREYVPTVHSFYWPHNAIAKAQVALLRAGLADQTITKLAFISQSTIPIVSPDEAYDKLTSDDRSWLDREGFCEERYLGLKPGVIAREHYQKSSNWLILNRRHAWQCVTAEAQYMDAFVNS